MCVVVCQMVVCDIDEYWCGFGVYQLCDQCGWVCDVEEQVVLFVYCECFVLVC